MAAVYGRVFRTPLYILPALTLCALLFVVTGVQFWGTFFLTASLGLSPQTAMFAFAGVAASAPTLGVLGGGFFVDFLGGYKTPEAKKRTLVATTANAALAVIFGKPRFQTQSLSLSCMRRASENRRALFARECRAEWRVFSRTPNDDCLSLVPSLLRRGDVAAADRRSDRRRQRFHAHRRKRPLHVSLQHAGLRLG